MKIGTYVGAVGLALTGAAYANSGLGDFREARDAAIGAPGSEKFLRTIESVKRGIAAGAINPKTVLFEVGQLGIGPYSEDGRGATSGGVVPDATTRGVFGDTVYPVNPYSIPFAYFDGFETYNPVVNIAINPIPLPERINLQNMPSGIPASASSMIAAVNLSAGTSFPPAIAALPAGGPGQSGGTATWVYNPAVPVRSRNPYTPGGIGGYPLDRDAAVEQVLGDLRGSRLANGPGAATRLTATFLGMNIRSSPLFIPVAPGGMFPSGRPVIAVQDFYCTSSETTFATSPVSFIEGFILTRIYMFGYSFDDTLAEGNGKILRPQILGPLPNNFTIGQFYAPPVNSGGGLPPTYNNKVGEWFSVAVRITTLQLDTYMRDSGTDGSGSVQINDPDNVQFFENGWANVFPGKTATMISAGVWEGVGKAVTEFGDFLPGVSPLLAAVSCNGTQYLIGNDPPTIPNPGGLPGLATYQPTNMWSDNFILIGETFPTPPVPKLRIDYKDDIELYNTLGPLALQGGRWTDNLSSRSIIDTSQNTTLPPGSNGSGSPTKTILQENQFADNFEREEFSSATPPNGSTIDEDEPTQRAWARPATPVSVSSMIVLSNTTTARGFVVADTQVDPQTDFLLISATNPLTGNCDGMFWIRLPNPLFDDNLATNPDSRVDDQGDATKNTPNINYRTTSNVPSIAGGGGAFKSELVMFGDGTAAFEINDAVLTFDPGWAVAGPLRDELKKAKRIQIGMPGLPLSDPALDPPYTRFLSAMITVDDVGYRSGNNLPGNGDFIWVDDVCIDATLRELDEDSNGVEFILPYCEDFERYTPDESVGGQGDSPFIFAIADANVTVKERTIRGSWIAAAPGPVFDWCSYTILETFPDVDRDGMTLPDQWGVAPAQTIFVKKPFGAYACPTRTNMAGEVNFTLLDPAGVTPRRPLRVRVGSPTMVLGVNGAAANYRSDDDRYLATSFFCRYELTVVTAAPDPSMGGTPFTIPAGWTVGAFVGVDSLFAVGNNGVRNCPGALNGSSTFRIYSSSIDPSKDDCQLASGTWILRSSATPSCVPTGPIIPVKAAIAHAAGPHDNDVKGYGLRFRTLPRWTDPSALASALDGDSNVVDATNAINDVTMVTIDPLNRFGQVVCFINVNAGAPTPRGAFSSALGFVPKASAAPAGGMSGEKRAAIYWDIYVQDNNTRKEFILTGDENDCDGNGVNNFVMGLRFGGPDPADGVPIGNIARWTSISLDTWADTGVAVPVGSWFRVCVEVLPGGTWKAGMNTFGTPGGPGGPIATGGNGMGDLAIYYDQNLPGAHANAQLIATGAILGTATIGAAPITNITGYQVLQGADDEGDGVIMLPRLTLETLDNISNGAVAPRPVGDGVTGPDSFCFYEMVGIDAAPVNTQQIVGVNPVTGEADQSPIDGAPDLRLLAVNTSDVIAVRFNTNAGTGPVVANFGACPLNTTFAIRPAGGGSNRVQGTWRILGIPDVEGADKPKGGISNAAGPGAVSTQGYNDPNRPTKNILLARFADIPALPPDEIATKWYIDNLKVAVNCDPFVPPCPADFDGSGSVGSSDLAFILGAWNNIGGPFDLDGSGTVGSGDVANLLGQWGPCPAATPCS